MEKKYKDLDLNKPVKIIEISQLDDDPVEFLSLNNESTNLQQYEQVGSYNWLGTPSAPQIVIPGAPKHLTNWKSGRLERDTGGLMVDENHFMANENPMETLFRSVKLMMQDENVHERDETNELIEPFQFQKFDIVTDRNNLRKLFDFVKHDERYRAIRIDLQRINNLICFIRCEEQDVENDRRAITYGRDFERKMTKPDNDFCAGSFRQIVAYRLGELNFLVRFEVDAADYDKSVVVPLARTDKKSQKNNLNTDDDENLNELLNTMTLNKDKPEKVPDSRLSILRYGEKRRYHFVEVTSRRENGTFPLHVWPQLYLSGTATLMIGWQWYGKVKKVENFTDKEAEHAYGGYPKKQVAQFYSLLTQIVKFMREENDKETDDKLFSIIWEPPFGNKLKIFEVKDPIRFAVPYKLKEYIADN